MSTDQQTIDSYDRDAKKWSKEQPVSFYHKYVEKPAMFKLLPNLQGKKVLCIGVGTGQEAFELKGKGADVIGIDISKGMISMAKENYPDMDFRIMDMNKLDFKDKSFDFIYSSLALHYADDLNNLFGEFNRVLSEHGQLLFSTTHPIFDSVEYIEKDNKKFGIIGHSKEIDTKEIETFGDYFTEEKRSQDWGNGFVANFYHKPISVWMNTLIDSGFSLQKVIEPQPVEEAEDLFPDKYKIYTKRPGFIIFFANKGNKNP